MAPIHKSNEIILIRQYEAPLHLVWDAWTDTAQVSQWWGPRGFTLTTHSKELRPGGTWRYTMHGPDGTDYPNVTKYHEVEPLTKLVYDHGGTDERSPLFRVTVRFTAADGGTRMHMTVALPTPEAAEETRLFIKKAGGDSTWDRLAEHLERDGRGKDIFVIARAFDAPIERLFDLWTTPENLARWLPPAGFTMRYISCDLKTGGSAFYSMDGPNGMKMYGRSNYLEIVRPSRIVYTQQFADEQGRVSRHPLSPTWPETMLTTVTFVAEGPERTRVRIAWEPHGSLTPQELETFIKARSGMTQGWTGSLDKLETFLEA
jgi:uncharacterized protein YndB with AHSA1/START domain